MLDLDFTDEQVTFREAVRDFVRREVVPRVPAAEAEARTPTELFPMLGGLGMLGIHFPEAVGGAGADKVTQCLFIEEMAAACAGITAAVNGHVDLACYPLLRFGTPEQIERYVRPSLRGERIGAFAITEPECGSDALAMRATARRDGDGYVLDGRKVFITNGGIADFVLVAAYSDPSRRGAGVDFFIVDRGTPGFTVSRRLDHKLGHRSSDTAELLFEGCRVAAVARLGPGGFGPVAATLVNGRISHAIKSVGIARAALDAALAYAKERKAFGRPIGKFQAIAFKLSRMATQTAAARGLALRAAWLFDRGRPCETEASMAKLFAAEVAQEAATEGLQVFGGYGYVGEFPAERYFRDARLASLTEGTSEIQHLLIARALGL